MLPTRRWSTTCLAILLLASLTSCGRKAPWFAPETTGTLVVLSSPGGADILLDGLATGRVTPDTLYEVAAGEHVLRLHRDGWMVAPESLWVAVVPNGTARAEFVLTPAEQAPPRIALLEAFSNVSCIGCPGMAATLHALMAEPGYDLDRVLLIEYATNWPAPTDPHYQAAPLQNTARMTFYQACLTVGIPTLVLDGSLAGQSGQPPSLAVLRGLVDVQLAGDPGFGIAVEASTTAVGTAIAARATLRAGRALVRPGAVLAFALVQDPVTYASAPGNQGETEFHWIMRDLVHAADPPLPLAAGDSVVRAVTLTRQVTWPAACLHVIAFLQDPATREILQAGHAAVGADGALPARDAQSATRRTLPSPRTRTSRGSP